MIFTVEYECNEDISELTTEEVAKLTAALNADKWFCDDWYIEGDALIVNGSIELDDENCFDETDVELELKLILREVGIEDPDITVKSEYPDEDDWWLSRAL